MRCVITQNIWSKWIEQRARSQGRADTRPYTNHTEELIPAETHICCRLRFWVCANVHQRRFAASEGAFDSRFDVVWFFYKFSVTAQRLDHLVIPLIAEVAADVGRADIACRHPSCLF